MSEFDQEPKDAEQANATMEEQADGTNAAPEEGDEMTKLQADLDRFRDLALRSHADFDNYRKRAAREREDAVKYANNSLLERLIPIIDNFELGLAAANSGEQNAASTILSGMSMVQKQLQDFLTDSGVQVIETEGQKFDPNLHEAIAQENSDEIEEGGIIRQLRKGYKLRDRLLRPANVIVSRGKSA